MLPVEDDLEVDNLSKKANWSLLTICIESWHVQVINEEEEVLSSCWSIVLSSSSIDLTEDNSLESLGVGVRVEVDRGVGSCLWVQVCYIVLNDCGLTSTGNTDVNNSLQGWSGLVKTQDVLLAHSFSSWDNDILEESIKLRIIVLLDFISPWNE